MSSDKPWINVHLSIKSLTWDTQTFKISWIYIHISETVNNINPLIFFHRIISIVTMSLKNHNYSSIIFINYFPIIFIISFYIRQFNKNLFDSVTNFYGYNLILFLPPKESLEHVLCPHKRISEKATTAFGSANKLSGNVWMALSSEFARLP